MNIPEGISVPNAELVYRIHRFRPGRPETTVVVNCAGRTRSIIGAQTLINAMSILGNEQGGRLARRHDGLALGGVPARLRDGTECAGRQFERRCQIESP